MDLGGIRLPGATLLVGLVVTVLVFMFEGPAAAQTGNRNQYNNNRVENNVTITNNNGGGDQDTDGNSDEGNGNDAADVLDCSGFDTQ